MNKAIGIIMAVLLVLFLAFLPIILIFKPGEIAKPASASAACTSTVGGVSFDDSQSTDTSGQTAIDDDGVGATKVAGATKDTQGITSYANGTLSAYNTNYIALNEGWATENKIQTGDVAVLTYNGKTAYAVYGDNHSDNSNTAIHAEISAAAAAALSSSSELISPSNLKGVHTTVLPNTHQALDGSVLQSKIDAIGANDTTCTSANTSGTGANGVPVFLQADPRWGSMPLGGGKTMAQAGCAITSFAMVLSYYNKGIDPAKALSLGHQTPGYMSGNSVTEAFFNGVAVSNGLTEQSLYHSSGHPSADIWNSVTTHLENKQPIIISGYGGQPFSDQSQHYIVLTAYDPSTGMVSVNDPAKHGGISTPTLPLSTLENDRTIETIRYIGL